MKSKKKKKKMKSGRDWEIKWDLVTIASEVHLAMKGAAAFIPGGCATRRISAGFQSLALYDKQTLVVWAESRDTRVTDES